jgi:hypothetical protein
MRAVISTWTTPVKPVGGREPVRKFVWRVKTEDRKT